MSQKAAYKEGKKTCDRPEVRRPTAKRDVLACGKILPIIWYQRFTDCSHVRVISLIRLLPPPASSIITDPLSSSAPEPFNLLSPESISNPFSLLLLPVRSLPFFFPISRFVSFFFFFCARVSRAQHGKSLGSNIRWEYSCE